MTTKRGTNPNSHEALRKATAARKKDAKQVHITLSPKAISSGTTAADSLGISRSELIERSLLTLQLMNNLQQRYHLTIRTPFETGEPYFASATQLGFTGWNGKPDYEASGITLDEAVKNLVEVVNCTSGNDSITTEDDRPETPVDSY
jgi:hypothetical protein